MKKKYKNPNYMRDYMRKYRGSKRLLISKWIIEGREAERKEIIEMIEKEFKNHKGSWAQLFYNLNQKIKSRGSEKA